MDQEWNDDAPFGGATELLVAAEIATCRKEAEQFMAGVPEDAPAVRAAVFSVLGAGPHRGSGPAVGALAVVGVLADLACADELLLNLSFMPVWKLTRIITGFVAEWEDAMVEAGRWVELP